MRVCTGCLKAKPPEAFAPEPRTKCGLQARCKTCVSEYQAARYVKRKAAGLLPPSTEERRARQRRYYAEHKDAVKARVARWQRENPERLKANRVKNDTNRRCKAKRRERIRAEDRAWRNANREKINAYWRDRNATRPEQAAARAMRRRARKMNAPGRGVTAQEWSATLEYFDHRCAYCLAKAEPLEMEHVEALARGGAHDVDNVVPACTACNASKKARSLLRCFEPSLIVAQRMGNHYAQAA